MKVNKTEVEDKTGNGGVTLILHPRIHPIFNKESVKFNEPAPLGD